jgi:hypothetical protein
MLERVKPKAEADPKKKDDAIRQFKSEAEIGAEIRETDTIMRTYYVKLSTWLKLKSLSVDLAWKRGKKVNMSDLVNEALGLLFEKYEVKDN